jgi:hypothetical protein
MAGQAPGEAGNGEMVFWAGFYKYVAPLELGTGVA